MVYVYPSFASDDMDYLNAFTGMLGNQNTALSGTPLVERENLANASESEIKRHLRPLIQQADILILLLGKNTHARRWVNYEIDVAESTKIPIVAVKLPLEYLGGLPKKLKDKVEIIPWDPSSIQSAIDRYT